MKISPPSRSLSKSTLLITPLFLCILALLSTVSDISYLFILQFSENVASDTDLNLIGSVRTSNDSQAFEDQLIINRHLANKGFSATNTLNSMGGASIPLVQLNEVGKWLNGKDMVRGYAPRWILPVTAGKVNLDSMIIVMDLERERRLGLGQRAAIANLTANQAAVSYEVFESLDINIGDRLNISFQLKNAMSSGKFLNKFIDQESSDEYIPSTPPLTPELLKPALQSILDNYKINYQITDDDVKKASEIINQPYNFTVEVAQRIKSEGAWASALHNVMVVDISTIESITDRILQQLIQEILKQAKDVPLWALPYTKLGLKPKLAPYISESLEKYAPIVAVSFNHRSEYYRPHEEVYKGQVINILEQAPGNIDVLALGPLYELSLSIKYFFDSIIQIFTFIAVLLYVNVMRIILKQVYDEKEIEIGVWRTLGIGGVKFDRAVDQRAFGNGGSHLTQSGSSSPSAILNGKQPHIQKHLTDRLPLREDLKYKWQMIKNVGHFYYWLIVSFVSTLIFMLLKYILIHVICSQLHYEPISQSIGEAVFLFVCVLLFSQVTCVLHMMRIYANSIVESMKPFKRTFDVVKIRVIKMATFGLESEMMLVAVMLIYYGFTSYYFIPRAVLYNNAEMQTLLFNSIFFFMILGSIMLCTVLQSYLEAAILGLLACASKHLRSMRSVTLKNLKAKRFTNLKISLSLALIFAFVLFFTSGINMEIKLIQSFINRGLGSDLVLENYDDGFNTSRVNAYLDKHLDKIEYSWMSANIARKGISISFVDNRNPDKKINCDFRVFTPNYMNSSYIEYYVPEAYLEPWNYTKLPSGVLNGFDTIYNGSQSVGRYNPEDTITVLDQEKISSMEEMSSVRYDEGLPKQEQVINLAISSSMRKKLGSNPGYLYKLYVKNDTEHSRRYIRARVTHVLKTTPGYDILWSKAFLSEQQANYLYSLVNSNYEPIKYVKLLIRGRQRQEDVKDVASNILALSPEHTTLSEISFVSSSFAILETYLEKFITLLSGVMNILSVLLLFLYTRNKCREQLEMYRILRAVGTPTTMLRVMVFCEVFVRVLVSVFIGIIMGIIFSVAFAAQIESILLVQMPRIQLGLIFEMAAVLLIIFSATVIYSTKDIQKMTVAQMARG